MRPPETNSGPPCEGRAAGENADTEQARHSNDTPGAARTQPYRYSGKLAFLLRASRDAALLRSDIAVLGCIVDHANQQTGETFVSLSTMQREVGVPRQTAIRAVGRLQQAGWIACDKRSGASSTYRLTGPIAGTGTGPIDGTSSWHPTGTKRGLRKGSTSPIHGTAPVPYTGPEQDKKQQQQEKPSLASLDDRDMPSKFAEFWQAYPRKVGDRKKAAKIWTKKKLDRIADQIIAHVDERKRLDLQWQNKQFVPHPATFLNGERWNDDWRPEGTQTAVGAVPRDTRSEEEIEADNARELARFGFGGAR